MKICVLVSSYDDSGSGEIFRDVGDTYQDPSLYVNSHTFTLKVLSKADAIPQIKATLAEGYDYIWNFLWGTEDSEYADVAGVEAVRFLESSGHPMLGTSSRYLCQTKEDLKKAAGLLGTFQVPNYALVGSEKLIGLKFPLIVKPVHSLGSLNMTKDSVVQTKEQLEEQVAYLKTKIRASEGIFVEEFIPGDEVSVMILETKEGTQALHPIMYDFPEGTKETEKWLDFETKFIAVENDVVTYKLWDGDEKIMEKIKEAGVAAFESLGVFGSGYARVDLRVKGDEVYVLEVNHTPAFFAALGNKYGDDFVIEKTFPGGHTALVDVIIDARRRFDFVRGFYGEFAPNYDTYVTGPDAQVITRVWKEVVAKNDFGGSVLDLGCGTGLVGNLIKAKYSSELVGVDLCPEMAERAKATAYSKVILGRMENVVVSEQLGKQTFDHVLSVGVLMYLDPKNFQMVLGRAFDLAQSSVTLTVENIEEPYRTQFMALHPCNVIWNHYEVVKAFVPPRGWSLVWQREDELWTSPTTRDVVSGVTVRFEKDQARNAKEA